MRRIRLNNTQRITFNPKTSPAFGCCCFNCKHNRTKFCSKCCHHAQVKCKTAHYATPLTPPSVLHWEGVPHDFNFWSFIDMACYREEFKNWKLLHWRMHSTMRAITRNWDNRYNITSNLLKRPAAIMKSSKILGSPQKAQGFYNSWNHHVLSLPTYGMRDRSNKILRWRKIRRFTKSLT